MAIQSSKTFSVIYCVSLLVCMVVGCNSTKSQAAAQREASEFKTLTLAYLQYLNDHEGLLPKTEEEFQSYVAKNLAGYLKNKNLTVEQIFTSPRDREQYVFFSAAHPGPSDVDLIGYEQTGYDGKRYVGDRTGTVIEIDDDTFRRLVANGS